MSEDLSIIAPRALYAMMSKTPNEDISLRIMEIEPASGILSVDSEHERLVNHTHEISYKSAWRNIACPCISVSES